MPDRIKLITAIRDYAQNCLDGKCPGEATDILSALVNTVDTVAEGNLPMTETNPETQEECWMPQSKREHVLVEFLLRHDANNSYTL